MLGLARLAQVRGITDSYAASVFGNLRFLEAFAEFACLGAWTAFAYWAYRRAPRMAAERAHEVEQERRDSPLHRAGHMNWDDSKKS